MFKSVHLKRFLFLFFAVLVILLPVFSHLALAQSSQMVNNQSSMINGQSSMETNTNPDVPKNLHTYTQNVAIEVLSSAVCLLAGVDPVDPSKQCLGIDPSTHKIGYVQSGGGAIGGMGQLIGMTFNIPVHTSDYFKDLASNFGITKHAYAVEAGRGFYSISPLEGVWSAFLKIVYMMFIIAFVIIGLLIMLRVKVDPRTVMSIQNQIPKIIIGLLLVTFSFAISGFLIDIMYSSIYLMSNVAATAEPSIADVQGGVVTATNPFAAISTALGGSGDFGGGFKGITNIASKPAGVVGGFVAPLFDNVPGRIITGIIGYTIGKKVGDAIGQKVETIATALGVAAGELVEPLGGGIPGAVIGNTVGKVIGSIIGLGTGVAAAVKGPELIGLAITLITFLVIIIALLFSLFRLWFQLISAYVFILIDIVFAPFWIALGVFPGSQLNFGLWLRDLIANLAAFPTAIVMFYLGRIFISEFGKSVTVTSNGLTPHGVPYFVPPMVANPNSPGAIGSIIGIGIIFLTPNAVNMAKAALKAPKFDTRPIGQAVGVGAGALNAPKQAGSIGSQLYYIGRIPGIDRFGSLGKAAQRAAGIRPSTPEGGEQK